MSHQMQARSSSLRLRQASLLLLPALPTVIVFVLFLCVLAPADASPVPDAYPELAPAAQSQPAFSTLIGLARAANIEQPEPKARLAPLAASVAYTPTFTSQYFGGPNGTTSIAVGDMNGDGALDIVDASEVYLNDGHGGFGAGVPFGGANATTSIAVGDVNGDGALDIIQGTDGQSQVFLNDGQGGFGAGAPFGDVEASGSIAVGDVNGDGALDIIQGTYGQSYVFLNDGQGGFGAGAPFGDVGASSSVAVGDVNSDGALDIIQGNYWPQQSAVYLNDGQGGFSTGVPFGSAYGTENIVVGDVNGDGALDIIQGNYPEEIFVYLNDGHGGFGVGAPLGHGSARGIAVGDVNGDGALDIIEGVVCRPLFCWQSVLYLNDGHGGFGEGVPFGGAYDTGCFAVGDMNGDGAMDIIQGNSGQSFVYLNDGQSGFSAGVPFGEGYPGSIAVGDMNGDGALDIVDASEVYLNDGHGGFGAGVPFGDASSSGIALGDVNGDGALDIIGSNIVYLNDGHGGFGAGVPFGSANATTSIAVGDVNGDGALDIVQGNSSFQSMMYLNDGQGGFGTGVPFGSANDTSSIAVGDVNGDGVLDIVQGNSSFQSMVYLNDGQGGLGAGIPFGSANQTNIIAVGDVNGDGALDIIQGNSGQSFVYLNSGHGGFSVGLPFGDAYTTSSIAVGDVSGDGALDIVVGNGALSFQPSFVYLNDGNGRFDARVLWDSRLRVAVGDVNGDGALDIIQGGTAINAREPLAVYLNPWYHGARLPNNPPAVALTRPGRTRNADFFSASDILSNTIISVTYMLFDPEGDLVSSIRAYYSPDGGGKWYTATANGGTMTTNLSTSGGALKFDGIDDYVEVLHSASLNITDSLTLEAWVNLSNPNNDQKIVGKSPMGSGYLLGVIWNQLYLEIWDSSGTDHIMIAGNIPASQWTHLAVTWQTGGNMIGYINGTPVMTMTTSGNPIGANTNVLRIGGAPWSGPHYTIGLIDDVRVYTRALSASEIRTTMSRALNGNESGLVNYWAFNEGTGTVAHDLTPNHNDGSLANGPTWVGGRVPGATPHVYYWDTFASGFFGRSDNVVFRLGAYPAALSSALGITGTYRYTNSVPVFQHPYASATTFPFRVRGTQVQVLSGTQPFSNAVVYDLSANQTVGATAFADGSGNPFRTNGSGYLLGRGRIGIRDTLVALLPITATDTYTLYYSSATPNVTGITGTVVVSPGVQVLTVSPANPLVLFNLDVSLEWDARNDEQFMSQLQFDLQRTSELLYDWTNGQAALGQVNIYHDREKWLDAHVRIYATNRLRPNAAQGGIASAVITDPVTSTLTYEPGQVRMGAVWNRYGESTGNLGEDWPRTLAHELGHYLFFLDDDYLGLDTNGLLIPVDTCTGTAMSDPYRDDYSEFHPGGVSWTTGCANTLPAKETGRWDWATVTTFYPGLNGSSINAGPSGLPLAVTQIKVIEPVTPTTVLPVPIFFLSQDGGRVQPGASARAFLFQGDRLTDLGSPTLDQVLARGARPGDRLCVYEPAAQRLGCEVITAGDEQLALVSKSGWQPQVIVTPVTSQTIAISVTNVPSGLPLGARLFPVDSPASPTMTLAYVAATGEYAGTFHFDEPVPEGYVQVWVNEPEPRREIVTSYTMGGNPGHMRSRVGHMRSRVGHMRSRVAPVLSSDGQVILFGDDLKFGEGEFYTLQEATHLLSAPPWATLVGRAYLLSASPNAPDLRGTSITFGYFGSEVPPGEEQWLRVYLWNGTSWQQLPTKLDMYHNLVSAPTQGPGLYALMSSIEIPLYGPGWDLFSYPVQAARPVTQALQSINGYYAIVYGYDGSDTADPWKVYNVSGPAWVNDLSVLKFGEAYWISVTQAITLQLGGGQALAPARGAGIQGPPATYYGRVVESSSFTPAPGIPVTAWINGKLCGQGRTLQVDDQVVYTINVFADGPGGAAGCGALGQIVKFQVGSQIVTSTAVWDNNRLWEVPLVVGHRLYLPLILKN